MGSAHASPVQGSEVQMPYNILVLLLGDNYKVTCFAIQLLDNLTRGTVKITHLMSGTRLIWANMLPRNGMHSNRAIDLARRKMNK